MFNKIIKYLFSFSSNDWHKTIYKYSSYLSIILIIITFTGVIYINPVYLNTVHTFILYYVCAILLIRFNPYVKKSYVNGSGHFEFDRKIAFTAGIILLTTVLSKQISLLLVK